MARLPRLYVPGHPQHIIQRGIGRQNLFDDEADYRFFSELLREAAREYRLAVHAYVLMPNHLHLLATPDDERSVGRVMQSVGRRYVQAFNRKMNRSGSLWENRNRSTVIDSSRYFLLCSCYIELNPVRAGLIIDAEAYRWSSCAHHLGAVLDPLITPHAGYWALGNTPFERQARYRSLLKEGLPEKEIEALRAATNKGWAYGTPDYLAGIAAGANRRAVPRPKGRPPLQ